MTKTRKRYFTRLWLLLCLYTFSCIAGAQVFINPSNQKLSYEGRIGFQQQNAAAIYWPGSSVTFRFKGTGANAVFRNEANVNYFLVIVDGKTDSAFKLRLDTARRTYQLAHHLTPGEHTIQLFKLTDLSPATYFYGLELEGNAKLLKPAKKPKRRLEFYGNSITAGHGVDVPPDSTDSGSPFYFNNYLTYGAITARHFNAQYHCTAKSGIGVMVSWFPQVMPEIYNSVNPFDSTSKWKFNKYQADIVIVNLFQNDSWLVNQPAHPQFKARFGTTKPSQEYIIKAYKTFIQSLRSKYPGAKIICCLGSMDATMAGSKWPGYVDAAVAMLKDKNIVTHFFSFKNTPGHPKAKEQQAMADSLIAFIKRRYWPM